MKKETQKNSLAVLSDVYLDAKLCVCGMGKGHPIFRNAKIGLSLVVQWFPMHPQAGGAGSVPGWGTKITHTMLHNQE